MALRKEGEQAARDGKHPQTNPHKDMDAEQWRRGYDYEKAERETEETEIECSSKI